MKSSLLATLMALFLSSCASSKCYFEVGVGFWSDPDGTPGKVPSEANLYCQKGAFTAGYYHTSDITRGRPFNDKEETSTGKVMVKYRVEL